MLLASLKEIQKKKQIENMNEAEQENKNELNSLILD
jgi:hypothetical protein